MKLRKFDEFVGEKDELDEVLGTAKKMHKQSLANLIGQGIGSIGAAGRSIAGSGRDYASAVGRDLRKYKSDFQKGMGTWSDEPSVATTPPEDRLGKYARADVVRGATKRFAPPTLRGDVGSGSGGGTSAPVPAAPERTSAAAYDPMGSYSIDTSNLPPDADMPYGDSGSDLQQATDIHKRITDALRDKEELAQKMGVDRGKTSHANHAEILMKRAKGAKREPSSSTDAWYG